MAIALITIILAACLLAPFLGADSRPTTARDARGWFPFAQRKL